MKSYRDKGVILKLKNLKEADKLVIIFGETNGRIEAVAKGASKLLSRKTGSLDLLNLANFSLYSTKGLHILTEIELLDDFNNIKTDLLAISEIFYLLELLDKFLISSGEEQELFCMIIEFLKLFSQNEIDRKLLLAGLEVKILNHIGLGPVLDVCLHTGRRLKQAEPRVAAAGGQAGYLSQQAFAGKDMDTSLVEDRILKIQRFMLEQPLEGLQKIRITANIINRIKSIQRTWIQGILERDLKSMQFMEEIIAKYERRR